MPVATAHGLTCSSPRHFLCNQEKFSEYWKPIHGKNPSLKNVCTVQTSPLLRSPLGLILGIGRIEASKIGNQVADSEVLKTRKRRSKVFDEGKDGLGPK